MDASRKSPAPWNADWLSKRRLDHVSKLPSPDEAGRFRVKVPGVKGVGGVQVNLHIVREIRIEDVTNAAKLRRSDHAYSAASRKDGTAFVNYQVWDDSGTTRGDAGRFEMTSNVGGVATIVVLPPRGYRPVILTLGNLNRSREDMKIVLEPDPDERDLVLVKNKIPVPRAAVVFADLSLGDPQQAFRHTTDRPGRISAHLFIPGHRYYILPAGRSSPVGRGGWFVWKNQERLDIATELKPAQDL